MLWEICVFNYFFKYFTKRYKASNDEDSEQNNEAPSFASPTDLISSRPLSLSDNSEDADLVLMPEHQRCCSHTLNLVATTDKAKTLDA